MSSITPVRTVTEKDFDFDRSPKFGDGGHFAIASREENGDVRFFAVGPESTGEEIALTKEEFDAHLEQDPVNAKLYRSKNTGRRARVMNDATYLLASGSMPIQEGGFLFKSDLGGNVSFHTADEFAATFDRILCDGTRVSLNEPWLSQAAKSRAAGDHAHGMDLAEDGGLATVDRGTQAAKDLWTWASNTETGKEARKVVGELRAESAATVRDLKEAGRETLDGIAEKAGSLWKSARTTLKNRAFGAPKTPKGP